MAWLLQKLLPLSPQVSVNDGGIHCDRNVHLEIPAQTALAYSLMELNVMNTGQFGNIFFAHTNN